MLQSPSEPENQLLEKESRILSASTTFVGVENGSSLLSYCFGRDSGQQPTSPLHVTELSFHNCIIRIHQNYSLQPPNDLKLLANSFCLVRLGRDPSQPSPYSQEQPPCRSTKPTGRHVTCDPRCPTTSHFLSAIHSLCRALLITTRCTTWCHFATFSTALGHTSVKHSGQLFRATPSLRLQNGVLPWWSLCLHAEQPPCARRRGGGGRGWGGGGREKEKSTS